MMLKRRILLGRNWGTFFMTPLLFSTRHSTSNEFHNMTRCHSLGAADDCDRTRNPNMSTMTAVTDEQHAGGGFGFFSGGGAPTSSSSTIELNTMQPSPFAPLSSQSISGVGEITSASPSTSDTGVRYICDKCNKSFRLESALIHHMNLKHNVTVSPGQIAPTPTTSSNAFHDDSDTPSNSVKSISSHKTPPALTREERIRYEMTLRMKETKAQSLPPEDILTASHKSCINTIVLVGIVKDIQQGYYYEETITQFTVSVPFGQPPAGETDVDLIPVRCSGMDTFLKDYVKDGCVACVVGQLRLNP
eukprot:PhF_6_TR1502/c0_g1_i2/m.2723